MNTWGLDNVSKICACIHAFASYVWIKYKSNPLSLNNVIDSQTSNILLRSNKKHCKRKCNFVPRLEKLGGLNLRTGCLHYELPQASFAVRRVTVNSRQLNARGPATMTRRSFYLNSASFYFYTPSLISVQTENLFECFGVFVLVGITEFSMENLIALKRLLC